MARLQASLIRNQTFLPLIQIASITGILGITFIITFIPSAVAMGWLFRKEKTKLMILTFIAMIIIVPVFLYGFIRIRNIHKTVKTTVGLLVFG